ncbi:glycerol-3-phosphate responsive antiterminator [Paenibacillus thermoaerophilus]|uniref:Glycerol uptake operon antiterminator regulatory protein n=1 Tax=Paenibacillus thermoaerophilus TaxID=1215385 RepID=A0ABW2V683_9BACL|nr:glycerol-3-phosphate responsive antiterminator [Paenibacillus thermoaerophilus]TMV07335.1 glycerol-3-phosphate responsive antiterminator [Paenibacillus thermoaerophilus]
MTTQSAHKVPIIASITNPEQVEAAVRSSVKRVNLVAGNILRLGELIGSLRAHGKQVYVHLEMVNGLGRDRYAVEYLAHTFGIDGIVSTKSNAIAAARQVGIKSIQRIFAIDTTAVETAIKMVGQSQPDEVELMPGLMPRVIRELKDVVRQPLIAGGLIRSEEEIRTALDSGADYVSIGDQRFWR